MKKIAGIIVVLTIAYVAYHINMTRLAHLSFDGYYKFRGCEKLLEKTDTYGTCELKNGSIIKIVLYNGKFLGGLF